MESTLFTQDIPRSLVNHGDLFPFATVVIHKADDGTFQAWQPEYGVYETSTSLETVLSLVKQTMRDVICDPAWDYIQKEGNTTSYLAPLTLLPDEIAERPQILKQAMEELFNTPMPLDIREYIFVSVQPDLP